MDGYSNLTYSSMLPLVETFKSLRVLHLEVLSGFATSLCEPTLTTHCCVRRCRTIEAWTIDA
jgi:hypothetical protein